MNNYGSIRMEEEKKGGLAEKLKAFASRAHKPQSSNHQKFDSFQNDPDLEGQTIKLREDDRGA